MASDHRKMNTTPVAEPEECEECGEECTHRIPFLAGIPEDRLNVLLRKIVRENHSRGDVLFEEDDPVNSVCIIRSGRVKLCTYDSEGREIIVGIFSDTDTIWEGLFMEESRYPYSAICLTRCRICRIYRHDFEDMISDPPVAMKVIGMLSSKLHDANRRNLLLSMSNPKSRVAGLLIYRKQRSPDETVTLRLDEIAASVALRPETVSRKLREMEKEGVIRKEGQSTFRITDFRRLEEIAES